MKLSARAIAGLTDRLDMPGNVHEALCEDGGTWSLYDVRVACNQVAAWIKEDCEPRCWSLLQQTVLRDVATGNRLIQSDDLAEARYFERLADRICETLNMPRVS
jgi:hypothetical protein